MLKLSPTVRRVRSLSIVISVVTAFSACEFGLDNAARLERAQTAFDQSEYRSAIIDTRNVLQQEPRNREARLLLGRSAIRVMDAATAEKELRRAVELGADVGSVAVDLGRAMLKLAKYEQLLEEIRPELAKGEDDRLAILRLHGDALMQLQRPAEARAAYESVLASATDDLPAQLGVVSTFVAEEKHVEARTHLDGMLASNADSPRVRLASASLHLATGNTDGAATDFTRGLELSSEQSDKANEVAALIGLVETRLAQNDLDGARDALEQLRLLAPDELRTRFLAARIAYLEEDFEFAQAELQEVLRVLPESVPAQFLMGAVHLKRGSLGQAEMHLSSVIAAQPDNVDARRFMAETRLQQDRADEAADILRSIADRPDADASTLSLAVRASLTAGAYDDAIRYLQQALANDPENVAIALDLAAARLSAGDIEEAEELLSGSTDGSDETDYRRDLLRVMASLRRDDTSAALRNALTMTERWPEDARLRTVIGSIAMSTDQLDVAREHFIKAQEISPADVANYVYVATIDLRRGDPEAARAQYLLGLEQEPQSASLMLAMARLEARAGEREASHAWLEKASAQVPEAVEPRLLLAGSYQSRGDAAAAIEQYERIVELEPENLVALNNLGWFYFENGDPRAERVARRAYELAPENGAVADTLGWIQVSTGNLDDGIPTLRKAVELSGGRAEIRYHLAAGLAAAGETAEARQVLEALLDGDDGFAGRADAEQLLATL